MEQHDENQALDNAIDDLVDVMSRVKPAVFRERVCDEIRRTVNLLLTVPCMWLEPYT